MKTIPVPEDLHKRIMALKIEEGAKTSAEIIEKLIVEYRKKKLNDLSNLLRKKMEEKGMSFDELLKKSRKIREEIADEWYPD